MKQVYFITKLFLFSYVPYLFKQEYMFIQFFFVFLTLLFAGSDIYEDARVRFEYKKTIPSEPVHMDTYLVGDEQHSLYHRIFIL